MESYIGKKVLVRAYEAGVYFGTWECFDDKQCAAVIACVNHDKNAA